MHKTIATLGLLMVLVGMASGADDPPIGVSPAPAVVTLRAATAAKMIDAEGFKPASYRRVHLRLRNRTQEPLAVDLCASHLRPRKRGSCQRLGIGPPVTPRPTTTPRPPGTVVVILDPGKTTTFELNTCCLDAGRPAPSQHEFDVASKPLPEVREKVLRWWADNPTAPQAAVNAAIWQFREEVRIEPGIVPHYREPKGRYAAAHAGTYYRLDDGELMSLDQDGIERFLGTEIFQVIPVEGAVYAVALGEDRLPDLWRLALTGPEPWGFVMDLGMNDRLRDVIPALDGNLVLVTDQGVRYWSRSGRSLSTALATEQFVHLSTRIEKGDRLAATIQRPPQDPIYRGGDRFGEAAPVFELWSIDLETGRGERTKEFWNVKGMRAGTAGVYGVSHRGKLRRLVHGTFRDLGQAGPLDRILRVGRKVLWLVRDDGRLVAASASTGRVLQRYDLNASDFTDLDLDGLTDDLVFVRERRWWRASADASQVAEIRGSR